MERPFQSDIVPIRLVFVCVENANRSQMAQAFARMLGGQRIEAHSAGSRPSGVVNPRAIEAMKELGYDLTSHRSTGLDELPDVSFTMAVTMGCGDVCPQIRARLHEDWALPDPKDLPPDDFRQVRDTIRDKVADLLTRLDMAIDKGSEENR